MDHDKPIPAHRVECPRCGASRWNEQNNGQRECLDCGQVVVVVTRGKTR